MVFIFEFSFTVVSLTQFLDSSPTAPNGLAGLLASARMATDVAGLVELDLDHGGPISFLGRYQV
jgi:hypothetical protein